MAQGVIEKGIDPRRVSIIPNGCDFDLFAAKEIKLSPERLVLYIGTIGPANGVSYLPRLAATIKVRHPDAGLRFVVIGDGKELNKVRGLSNELGLTETEIEFLGALPKNEIPAWLARCRMSIMTYAGPDVLFRDSVSNKFFDSLAAGRMVVANFAGFSTLVAQAAGAGVLLPVDDLDAAADRLVALMLDDDALVRGSHQAMGLARNVFDRDRLAQMLETVLLQALNRDDLAEAAVVGEEFCGLWQNALEMRAGDK
jgi:glycosyltransferase involved in cell wall biosynthesis